MPSAEFQTCIRFCSECDDYGSSTWAISSDKIQSAYC